MANSVNEKWLSPITTWEIIMLIEKERIGFSYESVAWLRNALISMPFQPATLNHEVVMQSRLIKLPHQDPADRFIAASAVVYELILVTADSNLIKASESYSVLPNK